MGERNDHVSVTVSSNIMKQVAPAWTLWTVEIPLSKRLEFFPRPTDFHWQEGISNFESKFQSFKLTLEHNDLDHI